MVRVIAAWNVAARADVRKAKQLEYDMAKSVNKVILVGNVGQDPDIKYTPSGVPVAKISLATNERFKDRNDQCQDKTEWHSVVAWQRLAEIVGEYVRKGSKLYVEGKLQTSSWKDRQSGEKKYRTEVVAGDIVLLGPHNNGDKTGVKTSNEKSSPESVVSAVDDDIPF
jgi:single-strand DNA-binding protein